MLLLSCAMYQYTIHETHNPIDPGKERGHSPFKKMFRAEVMILEIESAKRRDKSGEYS